jgi:hypothetical protein
MEYKMPLALKAREKGGRHDDTAHRKTQPQGWRPFSASQARQRSTGGDHYLRLSFYSCPFAF